jgi:hypothetical protein
MQEKSTGVYRTVVRTTFLEDSEETTWTYEGDSYPYKRVQVPVHKKGDVIVEIFGPYANKPQNQNYSTIPHYRVVDKGPRYKREDYGYMTDDQWNKSWYSTYRDTEYVPITETKSERQELRAVFALLPSGAIVQDLDWVSYK